VYEALSYYSKQEAEEEERSALELGAIDARSHPVGMQGEFVSS
jgi:hypothetical protein